MKMKTCATCGEQKHLHDFYKYLKNVGEGHDGYRPHCKPCTIKKRALATKERLKNKPIISTTEVVVRAILRVPGIQHFPCDGCWHYNRCRDTEVDCPSFRKWTLNGKKNNYSKMPDRYLTGGEFAIEL